MIKSRYNLKVFWSFKPPNTAAQFSELGGPTFIKKGHGREQSELGCTSYIPLSWLTQIGPSNESSDDSVSIIASFTTKPPAIYLVVSHQIPSAPLRDSRHLRPSQGLCITTESCPLYDLTAMTRVKGSELYLYVELDKIFPCVLVRSFRKFLMIQERG